MPKAQTPRRGEAFRRFGKLLIWGGLAALALIFYSARAIEKQADTSVFSVAPELPHTRVALVLGCTPRLGNGYGNPYFNNRMDAAAEIFSAGKTDYLLVSGDNHTRMYDEPTAMKEALIARGVPEDRIVLDYAGFSTSDSVARAKQVFGLEEFCVVSQRDHAMRAIYIAQHQGLRAVGFAAKGIPARYGWRTSFREALARVRTVLDVNVWGRKPHFTGPRIEIGKRDETSKEISNAEKFFGV